MGSNAPNAPDGHPKPTRWWLVIMWQSWVSLAGLTAQVPLLIVYGVPEAATAPLVIVNLGLVAGFVHYGGGSAAIDMIRAWRGTET